VNETVLQTIDARDQPLRFRSMQGTHSLKGMKLFLSHALAGIGSVFPNVKISELESRHFQDAITWSFPSMTLVVVFLPSCSVVTVYQTSSVSWSDRVHLHGLSGVRRKVRLGMLDWTDV
jgi:hypothetical protein